METKKFGVVTLSTNHEAENTLDAFIINEKALGDLLGEFASENEMLIRDAVRRTIVAEEVKSFHDALLKYSQDFDSIPYGVSMESKLCFIVVLGIESALADVMLIKKMFDIYITSDDGEANSKSIEELAEVFTISDSRFDKLVVILGLAGIYQVMIHRMRTDPMFPLKMAMLTMKEENDASREDIFKG